jgi:oligosaccharide repeat unit polymerase
MYESDKLILMKVLGALLLSVMPVLTILLFSQLVELQIFPAALNLLLRADKFPMNFSIASGAGVIASLLFSFTVVFNGWDSRGRITITLLFGIFYLFLVYPGILLTIHELDNGEKGLWLYIAATFTFSVGVLLVSLVRKVCLFFPKHLQKAILIDSDFYRQALSNVNIKVMWCMLTVFSGIAFVIATGAMDRVVGLKSIIHFIVSGEVSEYADNVKMARVGVYTSERTLIWILQGYLLNLVIPISSLALVNFGLKNNNRIRIVLGTIGYLFSAIVALLTGSRLSFASLVLLFTIWLSWVGHLTMRRLFGGIAIIVALLVLMTATMGRMTDKGDMTANVVSASNRLLERILLAKGHATGYVFEIFPDIFPFENGNTILTKLSGMAANDIGLARMIYRYINGTDGTAGPQAFGELYANWGAAGIVLGGCALGIVIQVLNLLMQRLNNLDPVNTAACAFAVLCLGYMGYSDISSPKTKGLHVILVYTLVYNALIKFMLLINQRKVV